MVDELTGAPTWRELDPTGRQAVRFEARAWRFSDTQVLRLTPILRQGQIEAPVEGADRIVLLKRGAVMRVRVEAALSPQGTFVLTPEDAKRAAFAAVARSIVRPAQAAETQGLARPVWLRRGDVQRPAWRVRVPTLRLRDLSDVWVDAESGAILLVQPVARFQAAPTAARVFDPAPDASGVDSTDLVDVDLQDLVPAPPGGHLKGFHVETFNCCKRYTCPAAATECPAEERICAGDDDSDAISSTIDIDLPASALPLDLRLVGFTGDTVYLRSVFCTERPRLTSSTGPDGWFATPIDTTREANLRGGLDSETDEYVEVQIYWATQTFFDHLRNILVDPTFCLRSTSMQCEQDGTATLDLDNQPVQPFHVTGNLLFPEIDTNATLTNPLLQQFLQGKGGSPAPEDRIVIGDYARFDNAAFIPALEDGAIQIPPGLESLAAQFNRPFDSNIYSQGLRDFGYDGDVVYHEFTHAVVWSFVPDLRTAGADRWGTHVEPGAMNEGWSDYFSASFTDSAVTAEYAGHALSGPGETGLRDLNNDARCPDALIGEVHHDSLPFSGALWDLRGSVHVVLGDAGVDVLDRLLLMTMAQSDADETMSAQVSRILAAIDASSDFGPQLLAAAEEAFDAHGIRSCQRAFTLASVAADGTVAKHRKDFLLQPTPAEAGLSGIAPSVMQFRVDIPAGSPGFTMAWEQGGGGSTPAPISVFTYEGTPLQWQYEGTARDRPVAYGDGVAVPFDASNPATRAVLSTEAQGPTTATHQLTLTPLCQRRTFYTSLVSTSGSATLYDVRATPAAPNIDCRVAGDPEGGGCGCTQNRAAGAWLFVGLAAFAMRRRRY